MTKNYKQKETRKGLYKLVESGCRSPKRMATLGLTDLRVARQP